MFYPLIFIVNPFTNLISKINHKHKRRDKFLAFQTTKGPCKVKNLSIVSNFGYIWNCKKNVSQMFLLIQIIADKLHDTWLDFRIYQNLYSRLVIAWVMHVLHMQHIVHFKVIGLQRCSSIGCQVPALPYYKF